MLYVKICIVAVFLIWAVLEGVKDAYLFHYKSTTAHDTKPPHFIFTIHRLIFGTLLLWITQDWLFCLSLALIFPIVHNGFYYHFRHKLNTSIYPQGWKDQSTTSTALINFGFFARVMFAQIGLVLLIADLVIY